MNILDDKQIELLYESGKILKNALFEVIKQVAPGVSTIYVDEIAEKYIRAHGGIPSFKNYYVPGAPKYPATLCVSINEEVVHGIPRKDKMFHDGDIVSLDIGAGYKGIFTDMAATIPVGKVSPEAEELIKVTETSLSQGIEQAKAGNHIGDIGHAVQAYAEAHGYGVVRNLVGHGIGTKPHTDPQIPNYGSAGFGPIICMNEVLAIEPMITQGRYQVKILNDGWTIVTVDGSLAAHFEHTVLVTPDGPKVVTR